MTTTVITMFEQDMTSTQELDDMVRYQLSRFQNLNGKWCRSLELWRQIVRSRTGPGEYNLELQPLLIPCIFPEYQSFVNPHFQCLKLTEGDIIPTQTPDPTKAGWYECELSMHVDPPGLWELEEELAFVHIPPSVCRVSLRLSDLTFYKDTDVVSLQKVYASINTNALEIFSDTVSTPHDIYDLIREVCCCFKPSM
jgi:hypothetical protein